MFDVNEYEFRFSRLNAFFLKSITQCCQVYCTSSVIKERNAYLDENTSTYDISPTHFLAGEDSTTIPTSFNLQTKERVLPLPSEQEDVIILQRSIRSLSPICWRISSQQQDNLFFTFLSDMLTIIGKYLFYYNPE